MRNFLFHCGYPLAFLFLTSTTAIAVYMIGFPHVG